MKKGNIAFASFVLAISMLLTSHGHNTNDISKNKDNLDNLVVPEETVEIIADSISDSKNIYDQYTECNIEIDQGQNEVDEGELVQENEEIEEHHFNLAYISNDNVIALNEDGTVELFRIDLYQKVIILDSKQNKSLVEFVTDDKQVMVGYISNDYFKVLPGTFVEIDKDLQIERLYVDGEVILESPVVTGLEYSTPTPVGYYQIWAKEKGVFLKGYDDNGNLKYSSYVDFWEPFNGGIGLHDAERHTDYDANGNPVTIHGWRNFEDFGGNTYLYGGSHGCVNETHDAAEMIYENTEVGTPVLVHK